ncbi:MAG: prepilin peptidase, partial [Ruminococcus sp.]|nr:prepilin peptidase [Ruminococcus sp.]
LVISVPFFIIGEISRIFIRKKTGEDFRAIELGDTILMFAAGALLGTQAIIVSAFVGILLAAIGGIAYKAVTGESKLAFGPYLSMGIAIAALWGGSIANWYIGLFADKMQ